MSMQTVETMFGEDAVKRALDEPDYADIDQELLDRIEVATNKAGPGYLRSWALAQPWPVFCSIVRVLSGEHARAILAPTCMLDGGKARCGRFPFTASTNPDDVTCPDCLAVGGE